MLAWHFVGETLRDGSPVPLDGVPLVFEGTPVMCASGFHAGLDPFDALQYAPGHTLCHVDCQGVTEVGSDKLVCTSRTILARIDAVELLYYFARRQALSFLRLLPEDLEPVVLDYLVTGDPSLRPAVVLAADRGPFIETASSRHAMSAVAACARDTARYAAQDAANHATWAAVYEKADYSAREDFNALVRESFGL